MELPKMEPITGARLRNARYFIGAGLFSLVLTDVINGVPSEPWGKWRWLENIAVDIFGPWGKTILFAIVGSIFLIWGFFTKNEEE